MPCHKRVKPTATARTPRGRAEFFSAFLNVSQKTGGEQGGKRSLAHSRGICFHNTDHLRNFGGIYSGPGNGTAGRSVGRRHKRISSVIHIQKRPLGSFKKNVFLLSISLIEQKRRVSNVRRKLVPVPCIRSIHIVKRKRTVLKNFIQNQIFLLQNALK